MSMKRVSQINALMDVERPVVAAATDYPAGHATDWHTHPRGQLVYAIEGVMAVYTDLGVWVVPPERAVWVPPETEHRVVFRSNVRMRSLFLSPHHKSMLPDRCTVVMVSPLLRELVKAAMAVPADYDEDGPDGRLMAVLMDHLNALRETPLHLPLPKDSRLKRITEALASDPARAETLEQWGVKVGASSRTLARLFQDETGLSFGAWRQQARLLNALERLAAGEAVTTIALDLGYESPSAFSAMFKRALGVSPRRYFDA